MKTIILISILLTTAFNISAFVSEDTTKFNLGGTQIIIIENEEYSSDSSNLVVNDSIYIDHEESEDLARWAGFEIGINGLLTPDNSISLPNASNYMDLDYGKSVNFNLNLMERRFQIGTPHIGLTTGLGFEFNRYEFKRNTRLLYDSDSIWSAFPDSGSGINYHKNFLKATYLQVPLILDFTSSKKAKRGVYIGAGVIAGYKIGSKMKVKYDQDGNRNKERTSGHFNINPLKLSATARLGFRKVTLYANYGLLSLFEKNKGPELYPFSFGISLIPF